MSLQPGEIVSQDLSPNAGILGTQIADNTIQLRNLTDDTFRIVTTGTATIPVTATSHITTETVNHNLGFIPVYIAFQTQGNEYYPIPWTSVDSTAGAVTLSIYAWVDATTINFVLQNTAVSPGDAGPIDVKYYLLQEKASIT